MKLKPGDRVVFRDCDSWSEWFVREYVDTGIPLTIRHVTERRVTFEEKPPGSNVNASLYRWKDHADRRMFLVNPCPMESVT